MSPRQKRFKNIRCAISQVKRSRVYEMDRYQCVYCGLELPKIPCQVRTVDHLVPIRDLFGMPIHIINSINNLVSACRECNMNVNHLKFEDKVMRYGRFACKSPLAN
jgi:5-methylcytosine-specific restriction endonuclease McrA